MKVNDIFSLIVINCQVNFILLIFIYYFQRNIHFIILLTVIIEWDIIFL